MRPATFLLVAVVLAGCQGNSGGFYDQQAKDEALRAAKAGPFGGASGKVSVGAMREREACPQAPSPDAGPCLDVSVTSEVPAREQDGNEVAVRVETQWDFFVWLKRRDNGRWKVTHTSYRPAGVAVNGQPYVSSP
jgi:hypothetical protein